MAQDMAPGVSGNPACSKWHSYADVSEVLGEFALEAKDFDRLAADDRPIASVRRDLPINDHAALREALTEAEPRLLLMVIAQLDQDEALLDSYASFIKPVFEGGSGIPQDKAEALRNRAFDLLTGDPVAERPLPTTLMQKLMSVCVGENVGLEFLPLLLEQAGFTDEQAADADQRAPAAADKHIVIIGAGLSGIAAGVRLGQAGYNYTIFDRNEGIGGDWWENVYPGVAVDTPSHFYSYSFELNPAWPRYFSHGDVLQKYLAHCAVKYGVRNHIVSGREVLSCIFDDKTDRWTVTSRDREGQEYRTQADAVVPALGILNRPAYPDIPGLSSFNGPTPHTAEWDRSLDLNGKKVAIIGVGASAVQAGPAIVDQVAHLTVFQREPHWYLPNPNLNARVPDGAIWCQRHIPFYAQWLRFLTYWNASDGAYSVVRIDPEWQHEDGSTSAANHMRRNMLLAHLQRTYEGRPDLLAKMTPDFPVGGKRIIQDNNWLSMMCRDNVTLESSGIDHVEPDAIITRDGQRIEVDVIILATGFKLSPMLHPVEFKGRGGVDLHDQWGDEDPDAYIGLMTPNFPNLFLMSGPNSAPNHGAGVNLVAESQATFIVNALDLLDKKGAATMEVKAEVNEAYNEAIAHEMTQMVWTHEKVHNYYLNSKRRNYISCPWRLVDMWWIARRPREEDYILRQPTSMVPQDMASADAR